MKTIGRVLEVWRYPVSSIAGEKLPEITVSAEGIKGDRQFGLFDPLTGRIAAPESDTIWRPALFLSAHQPDTGAPRIRFPDGSDYSVEDNRMGDRLHAHFGFAAAIGTYGTGDIRFPIVSNRYVPAPLHLVTTASLAALSAAGNLDAVDPRRFRPSVLIETEEGEGFLENSWVGHSIRIGQAALDVTEASRRCGMTLVAQPGISEDANVLRTIMRHNARNLGVYATVTGTTTIAPGDLVYAEI